MRRDSLVALLGDFVGLHNSPAYKPPRPPTPEKEDNLKVEKKERHVSVGELPDNHAELFHKSQRAARRQTEPAIKHFLPRRKQSRKMSCSSERSGTTISSIPTSEGSDSSQKHQKGRRGSETLLGSIAVFSKPLVVINGRI